MMFLSELILSRDESYIDEVRRLAKLPLLLRPDRSRCDSVSRVADLYSSDSRHSTNLQVYGVRTGTSLMVWRVHERKTRAKLKR